MSTNTLWTKARCVSALRLPDAFEVSVRFLRPVLLPSTARSARRRARSRSMATWQDR